MLAALALAATAAPAEAPTSRFEARELYREALADLQAGRLSSFRALQAALTAYPLYPYLEYAAHLHRLSRLTGEEVDAFRSRWADTPLAKRLYLAYLSNLARRERWQAFVASYRSDLVGANPELRCTYLRARYLLGERRAALDAVPELWLVGHSQPKACDPIFSLWIAAGRVTPELAWRRLQLALRRGQTTLARYLVRFLDPKGQTLGALAVRVHRSPALLASHARFQYDEPRHRDIVAQGMRRWLRRDWRAALPHWTYYRQHLTFPPEVRDEIELLAIERRATDDALPTLPDLPSGPAEARARAVRALLQAFLRRRDWGQLLSLAELVDPHERSTPAWRYWQARAKRALGSPDAAALLEQLARERHFYAFNAALELGREPELGIEPYAVAEAELARVEKLPGIQRAFELYALGELVDARREWNYFLAHSSAADARAAAMVATRWGWYRPAIQAAIDGEGWHDLAIRFPTAYRDRFLRSALAQDLPPSFLFAIARQESAFMSDARSPVGALGLMQLMPSTAKHTAARLGLRLPSNSTALREVVLDTGMNVRLGAAYLAELFNRFGRSRVLAAAAYNAGPRRVERWLTHLPPTPPDIFIENIPLTETRDYVQNVLVYAHIYNHFLGARQPFYLPAELAADADTALPPTPPRAGSEE